MNRYTAMKLVLLGALFVGGTGLLTDLYRARTQPSLQVPGGDSTRAAVEMRAYGCAGCHTIPGVVGAHNYVGPPLTAYGRRQYIVGKLPNDPNNLIRWLQYPQQVDPGNAMPNLGVTDHDARDIAAYLYTLK